jgi:uncharacterized protein (DUF433 family)
MLNWSQCPEVESVPGKMSGAWVFRNTRLPISTLFEHLAHAATIDEFIEWYPGVSREQIVAVIQFVADHSRYPDDAPVFETS